MIHFEPPPEPPDFDTKVRQPGNEWQLANPGKSPKEFWTLSLTDLAVGFRNLCGYSALWLPEGTVDHYLSKKNHPELAYEWGNYRYASSHMNSCKGNEDHKILDPFEVQDEWFEILLPSLQLVMTKSIPHQAQEKARYTLQRLRLRDGERVIRLRQSWYNMFLRGELTLEGLDRVAPLLARAVRKQSGI